jgi:hypothetical protein
VRETAGHFEAHASHADRPVRATLLARLLGGERRAQALRRWTGAQDVGAGDKARQRCLADFAMPRALIFQLHPRLRRLIEEVEAEIVGDAFEHRE